MQPAVATVRPSTISRVAFVVRITSPIATAFWCVVLAACGGTPTAPSVLDTTTAQVPSAPVTAAAVVGLPGGSEVLVAAGDIGLCTGGGNPEATARLLDGLGGTVMPLGDNAYPSGTAKDYRECYGPSWGRHRGRTRPVVGNHEYETPGAAPYYEYFGSSAGPAGLGYYSFDLGAWHVVVLNSSVPVGPGSAQAAWLRGDLESARSQCTLAAWHHPRYSSGRHGNDDQMRPLWRLLYEGGADVVLSGHDHDYERFAPQDADGGLDVERGVRQFVVGTGGAVPTPFAGVAANSEARVSGTLGVLKLTLSTTGYAWEFLTAPGGAPADAGAARCH